MELGSEHLPSLLGDAPFYIPWANGDDLHIGSRNINEGSEPVRHLCGLILAVHIKVPAIQAKALLAFWTAEPRTAVLKLHCAILVIVTI